MAKGPRDWSPRKRIQALETLATEMVGDGGKPNIFFVSVEGDIILITRLFEPAYEVWKRYSRKKDRETALEDRHHGTLASVEPEDDGPRARLLYRDETHYFGIVGDESEV